MASSPQPLNPGHRVAERYEVVRELGRGGMGVVYLCDDRLTGERVALKCVFFDSRTSRERDAVWFHQEVRALAALDHPAIVRARDHGVLPDGNPYLVMDALRGRSVHVWKYLCRIPWPVIWSVVDQVLGGLAHAHARGIIHGDLKPSNIIIDPCDGLGEPRAYLLDLGLAWLLADRTDPRLEPTPLGAPALPFGLGTPGWMAPEQIRNAVPHIGPPTDLYALGSVLFELLTRREVYEGTAKELLRKHRDELLPDFELPAEVPAGVDAFVRRLLAKRPWHRYRYAADARAAWAALRPRGQIRWYAPNVRVGDEPRDPALLRVTPPSDLPANSLRFGPGIMPLRPSPLVGRQREREALWAHAEATARGEGPPKRLAVLRGEAGVGKSKLAEWLCEKAHETARLTPLRVRYRRVPGPLDGMRGAVLTHYNLVGQPRHVIEQALLNEWEVTAGDEEASTWVAAAASWLAPDDASVGPTGRRFVVDKPELRRAIVRHVLERIGTLSGRPILLWVDDLHLAPDVTFEGYTELTSPALPPRMFFVATVRDEALAASAEATERLGELVRRCFSLELSLTRLSEGELCELLRATLPLSAEAESAVVARSQGNPLFALQLVHAWSSGGYLTLADDVYTVPAPALRGRPITTAELWNERLGGLDGTLRQAARGAAALGEVFHADVFAHLLRLLGLDPGPSLDALRRAEILLLDRAQRLRWPHALLREHVFAELSASTGAPFMFRAAADALGTHPDADSRRIVRQRVNNLLLAGDTPEAADLLLAYVGRTWTRARDVVALRIDLALLEGRVDGVRAAHHRRWLAETARHAGRLAEAHALAEEALRAFREAGASLDEAHCLRLLAHVTSDQGAPASGRDRAIEARAIFERTNYELGLAQCDVVLGEIDYLLGAHERARVSLSRAAPAFRRAGDRLGLAQCLILQALAEQSCGRLGTARWLLRQARQAFDEIGYQLGVAQTDIALAHAEHRAGNNAPAYEQALHARDRFRALENPRGEAACERLAAMAALDLGQLDRARPHAAGAFDLYERRIPDPWGRVEALCLLAQCAIAQGALDEASRSLDEAFAIRVDEAEPIQHRALTAAWLALALGRPDRACHRLEEARRAFPDPHHTGDHTPPMLQRLRPLAEGTTAEAPLRAWLSALPSPTRPASTMRVGLDDAEELRPQP
ncbi:MAG: protein kinase [Polyangiaceae bacterium]|nr:protein kinase [Polyangiaceae bacterium]